MQFIVLLTVSDFASHIHAVAANEFAKRARYISERERHVFHPLMKRCLKEMPKERGTFEEVMTDLKKYLKRGLALTMEEGNVR